MTLGRSVEYMLLLLMVGLCSHLSCAVQVHNEVKMHLNVNSQSLSHTEQLNTVMLKALEQLKHSTSSVSKIKMEANHEAIAKNAQARAQAVSKLEVKSFEQAEYYIVIGVGEPSQSFAVEIDTGSAFLWVPTVKSPYAKQGNGFDHTHSSTFEMASDVGESNVLTFEYGDRDVVHGFFGVEKITIGEKVIHRQLLGFVDDITSPNPKPKFEYSFVDGVLGMAPSLDPKVLGLDTSRTYPFSVLQTLVSHGSLSVPRFSLYFSNNPENSAFLLGGSSSEYHQDPSEEMVYTLVRSAYEWKIQVNGVFAGRGENLCARPDHCFAVLDTGAGSVFVPEYMYPAFDVDVQRCNREAMPTLVIELEVWALSGSKGTRQLRLTPYDYIFTSPSGRCENLILPIDDTSITLGAPFLRSYYTEYSHTSPAVVGLVKSLPSST